MRFYTAEYKNKEEVLISRDGGEHLYALSELGLVFQDMNEVISSMTPDLLEELNTMELTAWPVDMEQVKLLAPIVRPRQDVICLGINYDEHAVEADRFSSDAFGGERPYTIYFSKRVSCAPGTGGEVPSYEGLVDSLDYEAELAVILGKDTKYVSKEEALDYVFGYTILNDISARNLQTRHKQWYLGKSLDGFTPMGPCIVTPDELGDCHNLNISSTVNGQRRQNSNTRYMIQTVEGAISELSVGMTLQAGTIIATGTPAGVGMGMTPPQFLKAGDTVICEIEGIGQLVNRIV